MKIVLIALLASVAAPAYAEDSADVVSGIRLDEFPFTQGPDAYEPSTDDIVVTGTRPFRDTRSPDEWEVRDDALTTTIDDSFGPPIRIDSRRLIGPFEARTTTTLPSTENYQGPDFDNRVPDLAIVFRW